MKLTQTPSIKRKSGMTLLELTVVILVLLSLISILFIGARAWKKGSDRAASILQIRNVQQAMRSHANMQNLNIGATIARTDIIGTGKFIERDPVGTHPAPGHDFMTPYPTVVPGLGSLYLWVIGPEYPDYEPKDGSYGDW